MVSILLLAGCMDAGDRGLGPTCSTRLSAAESALGRAKANNIGGVIDWTKAAGLIAAARTQQQFSEYQNCVIKANSAIEIISRRH